MATPPLSNSQVLSNGQQPYVNQQNFGGLIGEISSLCPTVPIPIIQNFINNSVRVYYDRRTWLGLLTKFQIVSPGLCTTGTISVTLGSNIVVGNNTNWTANLNGAPIIGQSIRIGFTSPIYNIVGASLLTNPQTLTIELPWGNPSQASTGYILTQYYFPIKGCKFIFSLKNLQLMYRIWTNVSEGLIENWDPSRLQCNFPRIFAQTAPTPSGDWCGELWPVPAVQQVFPGLFYSQPPNLVNDEDNLPPYIRCDVVKNHATAQSLLYRPKQNPNYSEATCITIAAQKMKEFEIEIEHAAQADEALFRNDVISQWEQFPLASIDPISGGMINGGAYSAAMSPVFADGYDY